MGFEFVPGNVKTAMKEAGASSGDLYMVPIGNIVRIEGFNPRNMESEKFKARVRWIADSIKANGFKRDKPLEGYVGLNDGQSVVFLTGGYTRLAAAELAISEGAEIEVLPMVTKPKGTSVEDLTIDTIINNEGEPLDPMEKAEVCKRLIGYGMTQAEIARRLGMSPNYIAKLLSLASAPTQVRKLVESGQVSATLVMDTLAKKPEKAAEILKAAVEKAKKSGKKATKKTVTTKPVVLEGEVYEVVLSDVSSVGVNVPVTEEQRSLLKVGQKVKITITPVAAEDEL